MADPLGLGCSAPSPSPSMVGRAGAGRRPLPAAGAPSRNSSLSRAPPSGQTRPGRLPLMANEWRRRRGVAREGLSPVLTAPSASSDQASLSAAQEPHAALYHLCGSHLPHALTTPPPSPPPQDSLPSTSGRDAGVLGSSSHQPMFQLVAAWDSLSSRLPPQSGAGPDADVLVATLKLVLAAADQAAVSRALSLASRLAELAGGGVPLDAGAIAAGVLAEAFPGGYPAGTEALEQRIGHPVVALLADLGKVRRLPARIELYDDAAAAALRELCLAFYDVRATAVEVVARLHVLQRGAEAATVGGYADADLQVAALEALQIYAPLGHALGMGAVAARLEDLCFRILFPASYEATSAWLQQQAETHAEALGAAEAALRATVTADPRFSELAAGLDVQGRTKSPFSTLRKLLRLGNTARGGRSRGEVYDLIGLRAVVIPRQDLPEDVAEAAAMEACYLVQAAAHQMWEPLPGRQKDYVAAPKPNGYRSLHSAVVLEREADTGEPATTLEVQVRTAAMHAAAESGEAAHTAYKGGLDAAQARQLREWTEALLSSAVPAALPPVAAPDATAAAPAEALFRSLDIDGDGKVSLEELRMGVAELGGGAAIDGAAEALLAAADLNSDGEVSLEEFLDFQNRVGIVHAASAMDEATAAAAEELRRRGALRPAPGRVPAIGNGSGDASALHSWNSRATGSADGGDSPRGAGKAARPFQAQASFVERQDTGTDISGAWALDATSMDDPSPSATPPAARSPYAAAEEPVAAVPPTAGPSSSSGSTENNLLSPPQRPETSETGADATIANGWRMERALRNFMRMFKRAGVAEVAATWQLVPLTADAAAVPAAADAAGQALGPPVPLPRHGPCIVGAVRNRDCDVIIDVPTVSGRHARLEVIRQHALGLSKLVLMDLGSTNGTYVNRTRITPFKEVPLYPGDIVCLAEPPVAFEVAVAPAAGDSSGGAWGLATVAALRAAAALEAEAASRGVFAPVEALGAADVGAAARGMLAAGEYQAAYMLLLGSAMADPGNAGLWAQLAAMERQRARRAVQGSSAGTARAFLRAAAERYEADTDPAPRRAGLAKVFSSWALLEYDQRNDGPARILFQKAVRAARAHPDGAAALGAAKLLFTWASREWKLGDAPLAARLCREALEVEPANAYALTLLGNIELAGGDAAAAKVLFRRAVATDACFISALQSWARLEAAAGNIKAARGLFRRAARAQPDNAYVLQAWGVAEGRAGRLEEARQLFRRCTDVDPRCRAAWHAWGRLEEDAGDVARARELYGAALALKPTSVETLSALGRLERADGQIHTAKMHFETALKADPRHAPALHELAQVRRAEGADAEAYRLEKKAKGVNQDRRAMLAQVKPGAGGARRAQQAWRVEGSVDSTRQQHQSRAN